MTRHFKLEEYQCPECGFDFIVYMDGVACPKCGYTNPSAPQSHKDFIPVVLSNMKINKISLGQYTPHAWLIATSTDALLSECFHFFDIVEKLEGMNFNSALQKFSGETEDQTKYFTQLFIEVNKGIKEHKIDQIKRGRIKKILDSWIYNFLP